MASTRIATRARASTSSRLLTRCSLCSVAAAPRSADLLKHIRQQSTSATAAAAREASSSEAAPSSSGPSTSASAFNAPPSSSDAAQASSSQAAAGPSRSSTTRLIAATILSRPPRALSPLSTLEREYYRYARKIDRAIGGQFNPEWYFRKGSQAEQGWKDLVQAAEQGKELEAFPSAEEQAQAGKADNAADSDLHNLERRKDRTLYLLAKKKRSEHAWQFPQGGVEGKESLVQAALRELSEEFGSELDVWQTGKVPAAWYGYKLPTATERGEKDAKVFFMPARVMRGTPVPNQEEGLVDYAWCTREEVQEKVANEAYFKSVQAALSH